MQIDMKRFHAAFFDEASEHLAAMEESLLQLERTVPMTASCCRGFLAAHSIKGASGTFGFNDIAGFTHSLEGLLDRMRNGRVATTPELVAVLLQSADALAALLSAAKDGTPLPPDIESLVAALEAAKAGSPPPPAAPLEAPPAAAAKGIRDYQITFAPGPDLIRQGMDPLLLLRDLAELGTITSISVDASRLPGLADMAPDECYLGWTIGLKSAKSATTFAPSSFSSKTAARSPWKKTFSQRRRPPPRRWKPAANLIHRGGPRGRRLGRWNRRRSASPLRRSTNC